MPFRKVVDVSLEDINFALERARDTGLSLREMLSLALSVGILEMRWEKLKIEKRRERREANVQTSVTETGLR